MARRTYNKAFKDEVVRKSLEPGKSVAEVAQEYGVSVNTLYGWRSQEQDKIDQDQPMSIEHMNNLKSLVKEVQETDPEILDSLLAALEKIISYNRNGSRRHKG